jgi:hypothetical protein
MSSVISEQIQSIIFKRSQGIRNEPQSNPATFDMLTVNTAVACLKQYCCLRKRYEFCFMHFSSIAFEVPCCSLVGIANWLRFGRSGVRMIFLFFKMFRPALGPTLPPIQCVLCFLPGS